MKKISGNIDAALNGDIGLSEEGLIETLEDENNSTILTKYIEDLIVTSETVRERIADIFNEAGQILTEGSTALGQIKALSARNAEILAGFAKTIQAK